MTAKAKEMGVPYDDDDDDVDSDFDLGSDGDDEPMDDKPHQQMLWAAGVGHSDRKRQLSKAVVTEAYPESEFNVRGAAAEGAGEGVLSIEDMLEGLGAGVQAAGLKKRLSKLEKDKAKPLAVPLAPVIQQRLERKAAYEATKEDVTKWQPLVKANREVATLEFPNRRDGAPRKTSVQAVLSDFKPETQLELEVDALLSAAGVAGGARQVEKVEALELNKLSVEQVKERQARLSRMRALLFYHDERAKRLKAIKSKSYRKHEAARLKMLAKKKGLTATDSEALEAEQRKADFERAQERLKLTHRNTSRWARRLIKQGLAHLPGTREAIAEQLRIGEAIRKKAEAAPHRGDDSDEEDDGSSSSGDEEVDPETAAADRKRKLRDAVIGGLAHGDAAEALGVPADDKIAKLMKLPFMDRAARRRQAEAQADAQAMLDEIDAGEEGEEGEEGGKGPAGKAAGSAPGRFRVGPGQQPQQRAEEEPRAGGWGGEGGSDEEGDGWDDGEAEERRHRSAAAEGKRAAAVGAAAAGGGGKGGGGGGGAAGQAQEKKGAKQKQKKARKGGDGAVGGADGGGAGAAPKPPPQAKAAPSQGAAQAAAESKKRPRDPDKPKTPGERLTKKPAGLVEGVPHPAPAPAPEPAAEAPANGGDDDDGALLGGVSARQRDLIKAAFAGDDVEAEFAALKAAEVADGLPKVEVDRVLPGWGSWASEQREPRHVREQRQQAEKLQKEAAAKRADAKKPHVVISERMEKSADAYNVTSVPFPYTSREVFEGAMRMPLGRETNTDTAFRNMTRPKVLKKAGAMIDPIKYGKPVEQKAGGAGAGGGGGGAAGAGAAPGGNKKAGGGKKPGSGGGRGGGGGGKKKH